MLALVGVAFAGLYLPGLARLGLLAAAALVTRWLVPEGAPRLAVGLVVGWLALAWGLGLLSPVVAAALLVLIGVEARLWWDRTEPDAEADAEEPAPPPRELSPDERLDALLADAPLDGLPFAEIVEAMTPYMVKSTVSLKLKQRAWSLGRGRWRARPAGVDEP